MAATVLRCVGNVSVPYDKHRTFGGPNLQRQKEWRVFIVALEFQELAKVVELIVRRADCDQGSVVHTMDGHDHFKEEVGIDKGCFL
jgi:hypothetical protein